jgi:DNA-binding SARP family transcriptional activator
MEPFVGLRISLLGKFQIFWADQPFDVVHGRKQQELLGYLLVHRDRPLPREMIADVFWGEYPTERSRKYLRQAIWLLQSSLKQLCPDAPEILLVEDHWIQVNPRASFKLDIAEFEEACSDCREIAPSAIDVPHLEMLKAAATLYHSDLLEGWYSDWCLFERERLQNEYLGLLERIIECCHRLQDYQLGLEYAQKALYLDPFAERIHYQIMHLQHASGRRAEALRQYKRCEQLMREEMNASPSPQVQALYQQICRNQDVPAEPEGSVGQPRETAAEDIQALLTLFTQLRTVLDKLQEQLLEEHHQAHTLSKQK